MSSETPFVKLSNFSFGYNFSSNKGVYKLPYLSFGINLTMDGFTTVPSTAPEWYSKTKRSAGLICNVVVVGIATPLYLNDKTLSTPPDEATYWVTNNFNCPFFSPNTFSILSCVSFNPYEFETSKLSGITS